MANEGHHTEAEVQAAFQRAPEILRELVSAGLELPRFELFVDGSGTLFLGKEGQVTAKQWELATQLVRSVRATYCMKCLVSATKDEDIPEHEHMVAITFCCGLVPHEVE